MAEGRRMPTAWRQARQFAFIGATGTSGGWKVQVCGATWCMVGWAMAIERAPPSVTPAILKGLASFGPDDYGKPRRARWRRLVNDDRRAGRRPVPQPDHV